MNKSVKEGWYNVPPINRDRYGERAGLEGPFQTKAGKVVYYDPKEGAYYDPDTDIYLSYEEWAALNESAKFTIVYTTNSNRTVPMAHKTYDTREAATKIAESAVKLGTYRHFAIVEANVPGSPYNGMDKESRQIYQNLLYHGGGGSWTAQKAAQAEKNRGALAASADYSVYTEKDVKADGAAASAKYKEVEALYKKEKAAGTTGRKLMALKKAGEELGAFPRYVANQAYDMNGYGAIFTGKKPWEELSDMAKAGVVRKQAQIKKKKAAINDLLVKLGLTPVEFAGTEKTEESKLPPHLAKFVGKDGNLTPDAEARVQAGRKKGTWIDKTPKGYGPDEKVDESYQDEMKKIMGAIDTARAAMPALQAEGDMRKVAALKAEVEDLIYAVNKAGNTDMHIAKIHELLGAQTESENLSEADNVHATYLFSMSKPDYENPANNDTKYIKMNFMVPSYGVAHPQALSKQIKDNPTVEALRKAGYINFKSVASWKADLESELAAAQERLAGGPWIASHEAELKNTVATLTQAKQIMSSNKVLGEGATDNERDAEVTYDLKRIETEYMKLVKAKIAGDTSPETEQKIASLKQQYAAEKKKHSGKIYAMGESKDPKGKSTLGPKTKEATVYESPKKKGRDMNEAKPPRKGSVAYNAAAQRKKEDSSPERVKEIDKIGNKNHYYGNAKVHHVEEAGMPASIIKHKNELAGMSDKDLATKLGGKSDDELRQMAWRHGHGKGSDHYVKRVAKGKSVAEGKAPAYNKDAVDKEIGKDKRIGGKEAKAIHGLLKGRTAEKKTVKEAEDKFRVVGKSADDNSSFKSGVLSKAAAEEKAKKMRAAKRRDGAKQYDSVKIVNEDIALDAAGMEQDHEVQMARGQLYHAARDAIRLHQMLKTISEDNGIEAWVQSKITTAAEYLKTVADYMEYELINDGIDSTVGIAADQVTMPIGETSAGGIAGVVMPLGSVQKRKRPVKK